MTKLEKFALITTTGVLIWGILYTLNFIISIIPSNLFFGLFLILQMSVFVTYLFLLFESYMGWDD